MGGDKVYFGCLEGVSWRQGDLLHKCLVVCTPVGVRDSFRTCNFQSSPKMSCKTCQGMGRDEDWAGGDDDGRTSSKAVALGLSAVASALGFLYPVVTMQPGCIPCRVVAW